MIVKISFRTNIAHMASYLKLLTHSRISTRLIHLDSIAVFLFMNSEKGKGDAIYIQSRVK